MIGSYLRWRGEDIQRVTTKVTGGDDKSLSIPLKNSAARNK